VAFLFTETESVYEEMTRTSDRVHRDLSDTDGKFKLISRPDEQTQLANQELLVFE